MPPSGDRQRPGWFRTGPDPAMRVSDAERAEAASQLARHYGDGRLDQAEFDERVSRAMAAKTFGDLHGLFDDLPPAGDIPSDTPAGTPDGSPSGSPNAAEAPMLAACYGMRRHRHGPLRVVLAAVLVIAAANIAWHAATDWIWPGMWIVFLAAIFVIVSGNRHRR